jgi:hypothetical protein
LRSSTPTPAALRVRRSVRAPCTWIAGPGIG